MATKFETRFNDIETSRKNLLAELKQYPDDLLNKKPSDKAWSPIQVMEHLMISEEASLKYLQKKTLDTSKSHNAGLKGKWRLFITKAMFGTPFTFKAPTLLNPTNKYATLAEVETSWNKIRSDLFQLLNKLPAKELEKDIWKHAIAGKMNIYHMVEFIDFHFNRHRKQIERTIALNSKG